MIATAVTAIMLAFSNTNGLPSECSYDQTGVISCSLPTVMAYELPPIVAPSRGLGFRIF